MCKSVKNLIEKVFIGELTCLWFQCNALIRNFKEGSYHKIPKYMKEGSYHKCQSTCLLQQLNSQRIIKKIIYLL